MLKLNFWELLMRVIPETFILVLLIVLFSDNKTSKKKYIISSLILSLITYSIRLLPIHFGVHIILNIFAIVIICYLMNGIPMIKSISSSLVVIIILLLCEELNLLVLTRLLNLNINTIVSIPIKKTFCFLPSLVLLILIGLGSIKFTKRRIKDVFY